MNLLHIAIVLLIVCVLAWFSTFADEDDFILTLKQYTIICMILISVVFIAFYASEPTAMDVY